MRRGNPPANGVEPCLSAAPMLKKQAGNRGAIGTLGANGREGDSPRIENLDTGILNWLSFTNQCNQVRTETQPHAVTFASG